MGPTTWLLLALATMMLVSGALFGTAVAADRRRRRDDTADDGGGGQGEGDDDDDDDGNTYEFEGKILRAWLDTLFDRYSKNIQSSTGSTNIQRIAKKSQTSTSTMPMLNHERIAALSMFQSLANPYYQPSIYSGYVPLPYDATTRLIPIGQVPYQKEEYPHWFFVPSHTQVPFEYTHVSGMANSTIVNNGPEIKNPIHFPISPGNQGDNQNYDKELHTSEQIINAQYHTSPTGSNAEEPTKIDKKKNDQSEQSNSKRGPKLPDHTVVDDLPSAISANQDQTSGSQKLQQLQSTTTVVQLDTSTPFDTVKIPDTDQSSTLSPLVIFNEPSLTDIYRNSVSQIPLSSDSNLSNEFVTVKQFSSHRSTTQEPSDLPNTEQLETTTGKTFSLITGDQNLNGIPNHNKNSVTDGSQPRNNDSKNNDTIGEISAETAKSTQNPNIEITLSTSPITTNTELLSTPIYENTDSKISTPIPVTASEVQTNTLAADSNNKRDPLVIGLSALSITRNSHEKGTTSTSLPTTRPSIISTVNSEPSTLQYKTTESSTILMTSSTPYSDDGISTGTSNLKLTTDKNDKIQSTSLRFTSLSPTTIRPPNITNNTIPILVETKTEQTPLITTNTNKYTNIAGQNTNIPRHRDESTRSYRSTSTILKIPHENLKPGLLRAENAVPTSTDKSNTYKEYKISTYFPVTTKETKITPLKPTVTPIKQHNSIKKNPSLDTVTENSKSRKSAYDENRYTTTSSKTPRGIDDSELWYNHMYSQSPRQKELNDEQIDFILKKIIKLLKPEIERQALTKESVARLVPPRLGDPEKVVYILYPWVKEATKNMENKERTEINASPLSNNDKLK